MKNLLQKSTAEVRPVNFFHFEANFNFSYIFLRVTNCRSQCREIFQSVCTGFSEHFQNLRREGVLPYSIIADLFKEILINTLSFQQRSCDIKIGQSQQDWKKRKEIIHVLHLAKILGYWVFFSLHSQFLKKSIFPACLNSLPKFAKVCKNLP